MNCFPHARLLYKAIFLIKLFVLVLQIEIFPYSVFYPYFEQYLDIWKTALISLSVAVGKPCKIIYMQFQNILPYLIRNLSSGLLTKPGFLESGTIFLVCLAITCRFVLTAHLCICYKTVYALVLSFFLFPLCNFDRKY